MVTPTCGDADRFHDECGVFGVYGHPDAAALTALGLHALQHRGQEAAGIVAYDGEQFNALKPAVDGQSAVPQGREGRTARATLGHKKHLIRHSLREVPGPDDQDMQKALDVLTRQVQLTGR